MVVDLGLLKCVPDPLRRTSCRRSAYALLVQATLEVEKT